MRLIAFLILLLSIFAGCAETAPSRPQLDSAPTALEEVTIGGQIQIRTQHLDAR